MDSGNFSWIGGVFHFSLLMRYALNRCLLLLTFVSSAAMGCTIPVFRYALDRWEPDPFELILPKAASGDPQLNDLLRPLRANGKANLAIVTAVDATTAQPELRTARLGGQTIWSNALDEASLSALLDSPARQALVNRILAGDSVVWVIAEDGNPADAAEAERIEKRLQFLEQVAALPLQNPDDPDSQLGPGPPLLLKFTSLRLRRDDPAEALLLKMLAGPEGAIDPSAQSFAAAVFGRGRVLGAWPLTTLDNTQLEDACLFLVGRCSCRVKDQNPGWDILLNVDWDAVLRQSPTTLTSAPTSAPDPAPTAAVTVRTNSAAQNAPLVQRFALTRQGFVHEVNTAVSGKFVSTTTIILPSWQLITIAALLTLGAGFVFFRQKA